MFEALIIAGVLVASAILIYVGLRQGESQEIRIRRMARTLVRSVEQRAKWDITLNSTTDKWARIVLVLKGEFDTVQDEWLHIIIGEAQFDMEADDGRKNRYGSQYGKDEPGETDPGRDIGDDRGRGVGGGSDSERHSGGSGDSGGHTDLGETTAGGTRYFDSGENLPIPVAE